MFAQELVLCVTASMGTGLGRGTVQPLMCPDPTGSTTPHLRKGRFIK